MVMVAFGQQRDTHNAKQRKTQSRLVYLRIAHLRICSQWPACLAAGSGFLLLSLFRTPHPRTSNSVLAQSNSVLAQIPLERGWLSAFALDQPLARRLSELFLSFSCSRRGFPERRDVASTVIHAFVAFALLHKRAIALPAAHEAQSKDGDHHHHSDRDDDDDCRVGAAFCGWCVGARRGGFFFPLSLGSGPRTEWVELGVVRGVPPQPVTTAANGDVAKRAASVQTAAVEQGVLFLFGAGRERARDEQTQREAA